MKIEFTKEDRELMSGLKIVWGEKEEEEVIGALASGRRRKADIDPAAFDIKAEYEAIGKAMVRVPATLREYMDQFPQGLKAAVEDVVRELGNLKEDETLDDWGPENVTKVLNYVVLAVEGIWNTYPPHLTSPWRCSRLANIHGFVRTAVKMAVAALAKE